MVVRIIKQHLTCTGSLSPFFSDWFPKEVSQCFPSIFQTCLNMDQEFQKLLTRLKEELQI